MKKTCLWMLSIIIVSVIIVTSCKKEKPAAISVVGFWKGKYASGTTTSPYRGCAMLFRGDGTVRVYDCKCSGEIDTLLVADKAEGTYSIKDSVINVSSDLTIGLIKFSAGRVNPGLTRIEGSYGNTASANDGRYFMTKQ